MKRHQWEYLVPLALTILSVYFWFNNFQQTIFYFAGLVINILGLTFWWSAKITLAENWHPGYGEPKIKKLITRGIYSKFSHPQHWGVNLTLIGLCFIHLNLFLIILSFLIVVYFFWRMKIETKFLIKTLGGKYLDYKKKTWI